MRSKWGIILISNLLFIIYGCSKSSDTIIIEDFEGDTWGKWIAEGTAFESGPAAGEHAHDMVGQLGKGIAASVNPEDESATGILTSQPFVIEKNSIHFLISSHEIFFLPGAEAMKNPDDLFEYGSVCIFLKFLSQLYLSLPIRCDFLIFDDTNYNR